MQGQNRLLTTSCFPFNLILIMRKGFHAYAWLAKLPRLIANCMPCLRPYETTKITSLFPIAIVTSTSLLSHPPLDFTKLYMAWLLFVVCIQGCMCVWKGWRLGKSKLCSFHVFAKLCQWTRIVLKRSLPGPIPSAMSILPTYNLF